ncbi:hypothetical protein HZF05_02945 [Sphingomonas sp. CGMCC 1.13654]|uniref:Uncharacterized protein n=2 Tax=Sphingomonas chungangi TaxID=2683589 RepID=A0A838L1X2_9SPHN|nr:hypothetical protein [Sphingomonas chungangi]MVW56667.1 hypothetical protein [Sphingomonas chungangi]
MEPKNNAEKHRHLEWAIQARFKNLQCCLRLLRLLQDNPVFWRTQDRSAAAQELISVAFSLWRAAFLADKTGKREQVFAHGVSFLERIVEDNAIAYSQDKSSREWTFNYYTKNARYSLEYIHKRFPDFTIEYKIMAKRKPKERWMYCHELLDGAVDKFEKEIDNLREKAAISIAKKDRRRTVKEQRATVKAIKAAAKS